MKRTLYTAVSGGPCPENGDFNPFAELADRVVEVSLASEVYLDQQEHPDHKGVVVLWGGEDISPSLYGHDTIPGSGPKDLSMRDMKEVSLAKYAMSAGWPVIGVCRGAQFMCAMAGGALYQHVDGHATGHDHAMNVMATSELIQTNSYHHQMLEVTGTNHKIIAYAEPRLSRRYMGDLAKLKCTYPLVEPEVVYFPDVRALCIQGHPEWAEPDSRFVRFCIEEAWKIV